MNKSVLQLLRDTSIENLSIRSNIRYGKEIFKRGGVEIVLNTNSKVEAWVGGLAGNSKSGGVRRHVWFYSKQSRFSWHCSGNPKNHDIFCKHCVALAYHLLK